LPVTTRSGDMAITPHRTHQSRSARREAAVTVGKPRAPGLRSQLSCRWQGMAGFERLAEPARQGQDQQVTLGPPSSLKPLRGKLGERQNLGPRDAQAGPIGPPRSAARQHQPGQPASQGHWPARPGRARGPPMATPCPAAGRTAWHARSTTPPGPCAAVPQQPASSGNIAKGSRRHRRSTRRPHDLPPLLRAPRSTCAFPRCQPHPSSPPGKEETQDAARCRHPY
jgi:hypothetical protein